MRDGDVRGESLYLLIHEINCSSVISQDYHLKRRLKQVEHGCGEGNVAPVQTIKTYGDWR